MAGRPGRSGGAGRIDPALHVLRGTFRKERHARPASNGPVWAPSPAELEHLGSTGQAFVGRLVSVYEFGVVEGEILIEAAHASDRLAEHRRRREHWPADDRTGIDKLEIAWQRALVTSLLALRSQLR